MTVGVSGLVYVVRDPGATLVDGDGAGGCQVIAARVECPAAGITDTTVNTRDGDDTATISTPTADLLLGGDGADLLRAGDGVDTIRGQAGTDTVQGGDGNDILDGGTEADRFDGGLGRDLATYAARTEKLDVTINNKADDGSNLDGGHDNVRADVERVTGGSGADRLTGSANDDVLTGGAGNDSLRGASGVDRLLGGDGNDTLDGGPMADDLSGEAGPRDKVLYSSRLGPVGVDLDDVADDGETAEADNVHADVEDITGGQGSDFLVGDADPNRIYGGPGTDDLLGEDGADELYGQVDGDFLWGGPGNDLLDDGEGANQFDGSDGDDTMLQGASPNAGDSFTGGAGIDSLSYQRRTAGIDVRADDGVANEGDPAGENDFVAGVENFTGGAGPDILVGTADANVLSGGEGDDMLSQPGTSGGAAGDGDDDLRGGPGVDTANYVARTSWVGITLDDVANDGDRGPTELDNVHSDVEIAYLGSGDDFAYGQAGVATDNQFYGGGGRDQLFGRAGNDQLFGGDEAGFGDSLNGDEGNDTLEAGAGDDFATGGMGNDTVRAGDGQDFLIEDDTIGPNGADDLSGGNDYDRVRYDERTGNLNISINGTANDGEGGIFEGDNVRTDNEALFAGRGSDNLSGSAGPDNIIGGWGNGNDILDGMGGNDTLDARGGNDTLLGGIGNDVMYGDLNPSGGASGDHGNDYIDGGPGNDSGVGEGGQDEIRGGADDDSFDGGPGPDILKGGDGQDTLHGGDGNDDIEGAAGIDNLFGDNEDDYIRAKDGLSDTVNGGAGTDTAELDLGCNVFHCFDVDVVAEVENKTYP